MKRFEQSEILTQRCEDAEILKAEFRCLMANRLNQTVKEVCHWLCQCPLQSKVGTNSALAKPVAHGRTMNLFLFNQLPGDIQKLFSFASLRGSASLRQLPKQNPLFLKPTGRVTGD